jgi:non-ribosomal peptide synthetase component F
MDQIPNFDRRINLHRKSLVEVGVLLERAYGGAYARAYLQDVNIPELVILRVLGHRVRHEVANPNPLPAQN